MQNFKNLQYNCCPNCNKKIKSHPENDDIIICSDKRCDFIMNISELKRVMRKITYEEINEEEDNLSRLNNL